jgi:hypothetical protein
MSKKQFSYIDEVYLERSLRNYKPLKEKKIKMNYLKQKCVGCVLFLTGVSIIIRCGIYGTQLKFCAATAPQSLFFLKKSNYPLKIDTGNNQT